LNAVRYLLLSLLIAVPACASAACWDCKHKSCFVCIFGAWKITGGSKGNRHLGELIGLDKVHIATPWFQCRPKLDYTYGDVNVLKAKEPDTKDLRLGSSIVAVHTIVCENPFPGESVLLYVPEIGKRGYFKYKGVYYSARMIPGE
jgi:hypothetical protein